MSDQGDRRRGWNGPRRPNGRDHGSAPTPDPVAPSGPNAEPADLPESPTFPRAMLRFEVDGAAWVAIPNGFGAYGTGHWGMAALEAIQFARAETPEAPSLEALIPIGRFDALFAEELIALFRSAREMVQPDPDAPIRPVRFRRGEGLS